MTRQPHQDAITVALFLAALIGMVTGLTLAFDALVASIGG